MGPRQISFQRWTITSDVGSTFQGQVRQANLLHRKCNMNGVCSYVCYTRKSIMKKLFAVPCQVVHPPLAREQRAFHTANAASQKCRIYLVSCPKIWLSEAKPKLRTFTCDWLKITATEWKDQGSRCYRCSDVLPRASNNTHINTVSSFSLSGPGSGTVAWIVGLSITHPHRLSGTPDMPWQ